ncbi:zf-HC2 domain-containing protein [Oceanobacillus salinisoli]|uniref:zf-HC2 domain-containing protein n=1 Tax=Oceanobacillus salinisoli TaxID=2678611 RepID=UPI0012E1A8A6|nr:zf-HC2 domain-containing protein [Oceanobacillus salinisoli]
MIAHKEEIELMHKYLDGDLREEEEEELRKHLEFCEECQNHFHELKRTITLIQSSESVRAPSDFTNHVMSRLPKEKNGMKYKRWFKRHPIVTAAAIFFIFMLSGMFTQWNQDGELVVSKQENLIVQGDTVIVPEGVVVDDNLVVKNGNLIVKGTIDGDVTIINGKLIEEEAVSGESLMASVGEINGEINSVDRMFEWLWYQAKTLFEKVFSLE